MATQTYVNSVTLTDAGEFNRFDTAAYPVLTSVAGTNTVTATGPANYTFASTSQPLILIPANTNTGATTVNVTPSGGAAIGAKNLYLNGQPMTGGELVVGVPLIIQADGTQFNAVGNSYQRLKIAPTASGKNIAARTNASTPNTKLDITADEMILTNSTGNAIRVTSVNGTIDFGATGANGLDTGSQTSSTWYYGYVIAKEDGTVALLGSASSSAPTMPTGYTFKALVTAARSNGSTQFIKYRQFGNETYFEVSQNVLSTGSATTETSVDLSPAVPPNALSARIACFMKGQAGSATSSAVDLRIVSGSNFYIFNMTVDGSAGHATTDNATYEIPNLSQNVFYIWTDSNFGTVRQFSIDVNGFKLPGGGE